MRRGTLPRVVRGKEACHARNKRDKPRVYRSRVDKSGRVAIPAELRSEFGLAAGSAILVIKDNEGVHLESPAHALRSLQQYFKQLVPAGVSLVDELIAERRQEALKESRE